MRNRLMITAATAALIAGTGFAYAQGTGGHEKGAGGAGMQQSSPSATGAESHGGAAGTRSSQSEEKGGAANRSAQQEKSGGQKGTVGQSTGEKSAQESKGEKSKGMSSQNEKGAAGKDMKAEGQERNGKMKAEGQERNGKKAEGREGRDNNMKAEGREGRENKAEGREGRENNKNAEGREGRDNNRNAEGREGRENNMKAEGREGRNGTATTGQAGAGARLSTEQRSRITTIIRGEHVSPVNNVNFPVTVGTRVPREIGFHPLPADIVTIYPEWRGYEFFLARDEIIVVDPRTLEIVAVLPA